MASGGPLSQPQPLMSIDELKQEAERRLQAFGLSIVTDAEMADWNERKNAAAIFARDMPPNAGWIEEDSGFLTKEFYIHADPRSNEFAVYRKAWFHDYSGNGDYEFLLTDGSRNELELPTPPAAPTPGTPRPQ